MAEEQQETRHLPVLASAPEARPIERVEPTMPLSAPVAAATSGVLAGLAAMALVRIVRGGSRRRGAIRVGGRRGKKLEIANSRSFLVDVHMLKR